jgi:hypothetical protein
LEVENTYQYCYRGQRRQLALDLHPTQEVQLAEPLGLGANPKNSATILQWSGKPKAKPPCMERSASEELG